MEIAIDLMASLRDRVESASGNAVDGAIDWSALHDRLVAGHALRRELARTDSRAPIQTGGFALWAASAHAPSNASRVVNRTDLADGKEPAGIEVGIAELFNDGGRG